MSNVETSLTVELSRRCKAVGWSALLEPLLVAAYINIQQFFDHFLILGMIFSGFSFKKIDSGFT